jgi:hypothetical protein
VSWFAIYCTTVAKGSFDQQIWGSTVLVYGRWLMVNAFVNFWSAHTVQTLKLLSSKVAQNNLEIGSLGRSCLRTLRTYSSCCSGIYNSFTYIPDMDVALDKYIVFI